MNERKEYLASTSAHFLSDISLCGQRNIKQGLTFEKFGEKDSFTKNLPFVSFSVCVI
jgi:hypothetical protein